MTSALSGNLPPGKTLESAVRTALVDEKKLFHNLNDQILARKNQLNGARSSANWLGTALGVTQVVLDVSTDVVSVLASFADNLSSIISIHGSDQIFEDLKQSLPSTDAAKRSWESAADIVDNLLVQIENLKSTTTSHTECMRTELEAHNTIEQQSQLSLDSLTQSIDALTHSMNQNRGILHPLRRVPTEILEQIFELAALDEQSTLQGELVDRRTFHALKEALYRTIPRIPTILASTCRRWRTIALNMALLWSFLRIPTLEKYKCLPSAAATRACIVSLSTFQRAKSCIGTSECEVVVGPTDDWSMVNQHLSSIPSSQISIINIVSPPDRPDFSQIPAARIFRIIRKGTLNVYGTAVPPPSYLLPTSALANAREFDCHHALPAVETPILSVTSFSLSLNSTACFPDLGHSLANFPNITALVLSANIDILYRQNTFTPLHHARIRMLSVTDTVIPHLFLSLQRGEISLPSLTHFILFQTGYNGGGEAQLQPLFVNVTRFDVRATNQQHCGTNIRQLLDVIPLLQQFSVFGNAVNDGLDALLIAPIKRIGKLVVSDSNTDGSNIKLYYDTFSSELAECPDDNLGVSIQFVNCPCILPRIREQLSS